MFTDFHFKYFNLKILLYAFSLTTIGILVIRSATSPDMTQVNKQLIGIMVGFSIAIGIAFIDYHYLLSASRAVYIICVLSLIAVLIWGENVNNATRWIKIPGIGQLQPSEFVKIGLILFFSWYLSKYQEKLNRPKTLLIALILLGIPILLIMAEPNLSTSLVTIFMVIMMVFISGISWRWIWGSIAVLIPTGSLMLYLSLNGMLPFLKPYQAKRIMAWIDRANYADSNYQQDNSIVAIGSGMLKGKGLNENTLSSVKSGNYLSEEQTDFIFAIIGEELGFIGSVIVISLFALLVYECLLMASKAQDMEGKLICSGVATLLAFQSFANIAVATGIFPNTGLPLPLVSYGVSSLTSILIGLGLVLNVGLQRK